MRSSSKRSDSGEHEENSHERWLVSYADFITLMFAFFAVLYATSEKNLEKSQEFQESIKRYLVKAGAFGDSGQKVSPGDIKNTVIEPPLETFNTANPETVKMLDQAQTFLETHLSEQERKTYILDLSADDWGVRITLPASALFAPRSEKFREDAMPFIKKLSGLLAQTERKVLIEGHVDRGETGSFRTSWDFASARAVNVLRFIQARERLPSSRLAVASFADSRPLFENRKKGANSRIEVVLMNQDLQF
ncbi:MAG: flagellar motor protein MotB [Bdellovibrionales bacterium]